MPAALTTPSASSADRFRRDAALVLALGMAAVVGSALAFQYLGGYIPCQLCLGQRVPYYVGVPVMLLAALSAALRLPPALTRLLLLAGGLLMAWGAYLGAFHAGVEWSWWPGPTDCGAVSAPADTGGKGILDSLNQYVPPSCDRAALRILGISLAGWNAVAATGLALAAFWAAARR